MFTIVITRAPHGPPLGLSASDLRESRLAMYDLAPLLVGCTLQEVERELILQTLAYEGGNRTEAATLLDMPIRTLRHRVRKYADLGVPVPEPGHVGFPLHRH